MLKKILIITFFWIFLYLISFLNAEFFREDFPIKRIIDIINISNNIWKLSIINNAWKVENILLNNGEHKDFTIFWWENFNSNPWDFTLSQDNKVLITYKDLFLLDYNKLYETWSILISTKTEKESKKIYFPIYLNNDLFVIKYKIEIK